MLCFKCSLKKQCTTLCELVINQIGEDPEVIERKKFIYPQDELSFSEYERRFGRGRKTTDSKIDNGSVMDFLMGILARSNKSNSQWKKRSMKYSYCLPIIKNVLKNMATAKQAQAFKMVFYQGKNLKETAQAMGVSYQSIQQYLYGHSVQSGGLLRKIAKALNKREKDIGSNIEWMIEFGKLLVPAKIGRHIKEK